MVQRITRAETVQGAVDYLTKLVHQDEHLRGVEQPGIYKGEAAERLGIAGQEAKKADFAALCRGQDPKNPKQYLISLRNAKKASRVPAWDVTHSADKSVSVAWSIANDEIAAEIEKAQKQASTIAMSYIEQNFAISRQGLGGKDVQHVAGLVYSQHHHYLSRALDPQIHTHNFLFNVVALDNGKFGALHSKEMYKANKASQAIYHAELAQRLEKIGFTLEEKEFDNFRIVGIPQSVLEANSNRRKQILEALENYNYINPKTKNNASLMTRDSKVETNIQELMQVWSKRNQDLGFTQQDLMNLIKPEKALAPSSVAQALSKGIAEKYNIQHSFKHVASAAKRARYVRRGKQGTKTLGNMIGTIANQANKTLVTTMLPGKAIGRALSMVQSMKQIELTEKPKAKTPSKDITNTQGQTNTRGQGRGR